MPVATAKIAPKALTSSTLKSRKFGITKPERIVLISGMPEPAAMYIDLPDTGGCEGASISWTWPLSPWPGAIAGKERFVSTVALELIMPNASAHAA
jgi:hypothetical protein